MARDYARVSARFWTGDTGRQLRALGAEAQVVALYLVTCPSSNMIGLYYLPIPVLAHETGLTIEGASRALRSLGVLGFSDYDDAQEVVWVTEMARHQVGEELKPGDKQSKGVLRQVEAHRKCRFYEAFLAKYAAAFHLGPTPPAGDKKKARGRPIKAPPKALGCQEQEQEQDQKTAAVARERATSGDQKGSEAVEVAPPPPSAEAVSEPASCDPGTAGPGEGSRKWRPPQDDDPPARPLRVRDLAELDEGGAELRARLEERLADVNWRFLVAAEGRKVSARKSLEAGVTGLGLTRAEELCWAVIERRRRNGQKPPAAMSFFIPMLEEALEGRDPMPSEPAGGFQAVIAAKAASRWDPLMARLSPSQREELEAEKDRLAKEIRAQGYWNSQEFLLFEETDGWLFEKWSRKAASGEA